VLNLDIGLDEAGKIGVFGCRSAAFSDIGHLLWPCFTTPIDAGESATISSGKLKESLSFKAPHREQVKELLPSRS
jgi:hypothetical protein